VTSTAPGAARRPGIFITLEGGEGAGKSVQLQALSQRLQERGAPVIAAREPGGTALGERLRDLLLEANADLPIDPLAETVLFVAARAQLVSEVIAPALARGEIVVCDRFADSTLAYQGFGRGVDLAVAEQLNAAATGGLQPDLTVLLDLPALEGLARTREQGAIDRFSQEDLAFHERVRSGYQTLAARDPERWHVVDATQPPEAVTGAIWRRLGALIEGPG
jgi:dTMP kinase